MSIIEATWTPSVQSVEKKNTKYDLSTAIIRVYRMLDECKDEEFKKRLWEALSYVL